MMQSTINILDKITIDKIAAGEVVERPLNVVKELVENSIDANADAITIEIKDGGIKLIRVTDNGSGILPSEVKKTVLRHATSKIIDVNDLLSITSLGFRGEALSSISAVSSTDIITKVSDELLGVKFSVEGGTETAFERIGAPEGTTVIVKDLFYNVPARRKFLKSVTTEAGYIKDLVERLSLSHPEISFDLIINNKSVLNTTGNGDLKEVIYRIYGKEICERLLDFEFVTPDIKCSGYIGKPEINRSSRSFEIFFVNGRSVNCDVLSNALEEGYKNFLMQHKFPFAVLHFSINPSELDVNVHPAKREIRLNNSDFIYDKLNSAIKERLSLNELIPNIELNNENDKKDSTVCIEKAPEPFEVQRRKPLSFKRPSIDEDFIVDTTTSVIPQKRQDADIIHDYIIESAEQIDLFENNFISLQANKQLTILGQVFKTYWLISAEDKLYIMDQHAAHEKVMYERLMKNYHQKTIETQSLNPPIIVSLSAKEELIVKENRELFNGLGIEFEDFGLGSIAIRSLPMDLYGCNEKDFFKDILDELIENPLRGNFDVVLNKLASMACKAAVKGNTFMNEEQALSLLEEMLTLDNPYNCPHGRPTLISFTKEQMDKKFKRII